MNGAPAPAWLVQEIVPTRVRQQVFYGGLLLLRGFLCRVEEESSAPE